MNEMRRPISNYAVLVVSFVALLLTGTHEVLGSENISLAYQSGNQFDRDITDIISRNLFEEMLPRRNTARECIVARGFYTYDAFVKAARSYTGFGFGTTGNLIFRKREIAAFFAQTASVTVHNPTIDRAIGYCYKRRWGDPATFPYFCYPSVWRCAPGKKYYNRGPFQITRNDVYGPCGASIGVDLLRNPDLVETDPVISFKSAIWLWMTPGPMSSCHDVMVGNWIPTQADLAANRLPGFGAVTNIISGHEHCGQVVNTQETLRRDFYLRFCRMLGVSPGPNLSCLNQKPIYLNGAHADA